MEKDVSELARTVAERLAETRGDLSGTRAAYKAEIPPQLWNRYERAASLPGADALQKICSAFGVSAESAVEILRTIASRGSMSVSDAPLLSRMLKRGDGFVAAALLLRA